MGVWNFATSVRPACRSPRSPTATGSPTARRSRTTSRPSACTRRSTPASPRSTPPTSTPTAAAEAVLGAALKGERRESLEIFTKVYWPIGPTQGQERHRAVAQAHHGVHRRLAAPAADRLRRPLPGAPLRRVHPARRDDAGLRRRRARGQGALHRRQRVDRRPDPRGARAGAGPRSPAGLQPAAVLDAVAGHRGRGRADLPRARHRPDRLVARSRRACSPASTCRASSRRPAHAPPTTRAARR